MGGFIVCVNKWKKETEKKGKKTQEKEKKGNRGRSGATELLLLAGSVVSCDLTLAVQGAPSAEDLCEGREEQV